MSATGIPQRGGRAAFLGWWRTRRTEAPAGAITRPAAPAESLGSAPAVAAAGAVDTGTLFARAACAHSNLEQDWLWLSTMVTNEGERRYCLERALHINPQSGEARQELARLDRRYGIPPVALWRRRA